MLGAVAKGGMAAMICALCTAPASAGITFSGAVDLYLERNVAAGNATTKLDSSGQTVSRLVIRSEERIGDDMKVLTTLGAGIMPDTGAGMDPNTLFNRVASVAIQRKNLRFAMGRQFSPHMLQMGYEFDVFGTAFWGTPYAIFQAGQRYSSIPKAVSLQGWFMPDNALNLQLMVANRDDNPSRFPEGKQIFLSGTYEVKKGLRVGATAIRDQRFSMANPDVDVLLAGFSYELDKFRVTAAYQTLDFKNTGAETNEYSVGLGYLIDANSQIMFSFARTNRKPVVDNTASVYGIAYVYNLSKMVAVYASVARLKNGQNSALSFSEPVENGIATNNLIVGFNKSF